MASTFGSNRRFPGAPATSSGGRGPIRGLGERRASDAAALARPARIWASIDAAVRALTSPPAHPGQEGAASDHRVQKGRHRDGRVVVETGGPSCPVGGGRRVRHGDHEATPVPNATIISTVPTSSSRTGSDTAPPLPRTAPRPNAAACCSTERPSWSGTMRTGPASTAWRGRCRAPRAACYGPPAAEALRTTSPAR